MTTDNNKDFSLSEQAEKTSAVRKSKIRKRERKEFDGYCLIAAFVIPFLIMLAVYVCMEKHPFGNNSVLTLDMQAQYVYYFEALRRLLTEGGSWLYSWERTLGGEFMGIVAYYLGSPFNLLVAVFPKDRIPDAIMFIELMKIGSMGLTFAYYLRKTRNTSDMVTVSFGTMYALSAYAVVHLCNIMWLDAMVFLPLLVLGVESMIRERKFILYTVSLTVIFCANYYIGYMCAIFTFVYYLYYFFLVRAELAQNEKAKEGPFLKRLFCSNGFETLMRFGVFTVIALMSAAFILLCAIYSLSFGKTDFSNPSFAPTMNFDFLDLFVKMLPGSFDTVHPDGLPMIYCGVLALIAIPLFFMSPSITKKKKALSAGVLGFFVLSFMINTADLVWHGFSAPNWLEFRNSFLVIFFLLVLACDGIRTLKRVPFGKVMAVSVTLGILIMVVQKFDYVFQQGPDQKPLDDAKCILLSIALVIVYSVILYFMKQDRWENVAAFALAAIVCVEMFVGALMNVVDLEQDVGSVPYGNSLSEGGKTEDYGGYVGSVKRAQSVISQVKEMDTSFYRMESTVYRRGGGVNEPMALGIKGISHSTSTLNASVIKLLRKLGYASESHWTKYLGGTPVSDALIGIRYVITKDNTLDPNIYFEYASGDEYYEFIPSMDKIYAMQNTKALSLVYGVSKNVLSLEGFIDEPKFLNTMDVQNTLINTMLSETMGAPNIWKGLYSAPEGDGCVVRTFTNSHPVIDENGEEIRVENKYYVIEDAKGDTDNAGKVIMTFKTKQDGPVYTHLPTCLFSDSMTTCNVYVDDVLIADYFPSDRVMNLGSYKSGTDIEVRLEYSGGKLYISKESPFYFYYIDYDKLNEAFRALDSASMYIEEYANDYIKGSIELPVGQDLIFTTIPYDEGWKVYIDGKQVETVKALDSLLAIPAEAGFYENVEFVYRPDCAVYGGVISVIGILLFLCLVIWSRVRRVRAIVKCDDGRSTHFFHCSGDSTGKWLLEAAETEELASEDAPAQTDAPTEASVEADGEACEGETESEN